MKNNFVLIICKIRHYVVSLRQKVNEMEQRERIKQMELRMEHAAKAVMELSVALDNYEAAQEALRLLVSIMMARLGSRTMPTMRLDDYLPT